MAAENSTRTNEISRGFLLICVFQTHFLYDYVDSYPNGHWSWFQIKLLAPDIGLYFVLSGLMSQGLLSKRFSSVLSTSVFLMLVAVVSHMIGGIPYAIQDNQWMRPGEYISDMLRPLILGTGHVTYVAWFFLVLALTRLIVYGLAHSRLITGAVLLVGAALCYASARWLDETNFCEWRNLPAAVLLFFVGMKIPRTWLPPVWLVVVGVVVWVPMSMINNPGLLTRGICFNCDPQFAASTLIGEYGNPVLYALYMASSFVGLYGLANLFSSTPIGKAVHFFGKNSLQLLLMHGWLSVGISTTLVELLPYSDSPFLYAAIFVFNAVLHASIYVLVKVPIKWVLAWSLRLSQAIVKPFAPRLDGRAVAVGGRRSGP